MSKVPYINYNELDEFYTIKEACKLFELSKAELKAYSEEFGVEPRMKRNRRVWLSALRHQKTAQQHLLFQQR